MNLVVDKLTSDSVGTTAVLPETIALSLPQGLLDLLADQLVGTMGEPALLTVGTSSKFCEILTEFGLVFEGIGL